MSDPVVILGLGFTTQRLARRLRQRDVRVYAMVRNPARFRPFAAEGVQLCALAPQGIPPHAVLVHSVPPVPEPDNSAIRSLICEIGPRRVLYISSTGVYGEQTQVSETTPPASADEKGRLRLDDEEWLTKGQPWSSLVLRSSAIYGPGRGIHVRVREGKLPRGAGGVVSRIHVDDLAALLDAGIQSPLEGNWPVADTLPASSEEVASWCRELMGIQVASDPGLSFPVAGRSVDGSRLRELLGVQLKYSCYREGIPACLGEELA